MRNVPATLQAKLDSGATMLCRCWKIIRNDGVILGFTDHDDDLSFEGTLFRADSGLDASAVEGSSNLSIDSHSVIGVLQSDAISDDHLERGLFDSADVWLFLVDWAEPEDRLVLSRGRIGEIRRSGLVFEAEIVSLSEQLNQTFGRAYVSTCPLALGEPACGVDLSDPTFSAAGNVLQSDRRSRFITTGLSEFEDGWFDNGRIKWLTGPNAGGESTIRRHATVPEGTEIELWAELTKEAAIGDAFEVLAGCGKSAKVCREKFDNFLNFRGFPHLPGDEWVAGYPNDGGSHDGGSLYRS